MLKSIFSIFLLVFGISTMAAVEGIDYELMFNNCTKNSAGAITGKLDVCSEEVSEKIDVEINALSKKLRRMLAQSEKANAKEALRAFDSAQQSWLKYRKLQCALAGEYIGSPMYTYCPMKLGIARVKELREFLQ